MSLKRSSRIRAALRRSASLVSGLVWTKEPQVTPDVGASTAGDPRPAPAQSANGSAAERPPYARTTDPAPSFEPSRPVAASPTAQQVAGFEQQFALLGQRIDLLGERVDLLRERLDGQRQSTARAPQHYDPPTLGERIAALERQHLAALSGVGDGSLRPPRVPVISHNPTLVNTTPTRVPPESMVSGPTVSGSLPDLSLTSLLGLFELERSEGVLTVESEGRRLEIELRAGVALRSYLDRRRISSVAAVREALSWSTGHFSFSRLTVVDDDDADEPRSVNAVLLEASRLEDEASRPPEPLRSPF